MTAAGSIGVVVKEKTLALPKGPVGETPFTDGQDNMKSRTNRQNRQAVADLSNLKLVLATVDAKPLNEADAAAINSILASEMRIGVLDAFVEMAGDGSIREAAKEAARQAILAAAREEFGKMNFKEMAARIVSGFFGKLAKTKGEEDGSAEQD